MQIKNLILILCFIISLQIDSIQTINDSKKSIAIKAAGALTFVVLEQIQELIKTTPSILVDKKTGKFVKYSENFEIKEVDIFFKILSAYCGYNFAQIFTPEYKLKKAIAVIDSIPSWEIYVLEKMNESNDAFLDAINKKYISRNPITWAIKRFKKHKENFEKAYSTLKQLEFDEYIAISDAVEEALKKHSLLYELLNKALILLEKQNQLGELYETHK